MSFISRVVLEKKIIDILLTSSHIIGDPRNTKQKMFGELGSLNIYVPKIEIISHDGREALNFIMVKSISLYSG